MEKNKQICISPTRVVLNEAPVEVGKLVGGDVAVWVIGWLEIQVVLAAFVELGGCHVHADDNLVSVAGLANGILEEFQSFNINMKNTLWWKLKPGMLQNIYWRHTQITNICLHWRGCHFSTSSNRQATYALKSRSWFSNHKSTGSQT